MNPIEVVAIGCTKNYPGKNYDPLVVAKNFLVNLASGSKHFQYGSVIVSYEDKGNGLVEFHCINAGGADDLVGAARSSLLELAKSYEKAVTFYDNPKINSIAINTGVPVFISRIDDGEYRTFMAEFNLRS